MENYKILSLDDYLKAKDKDFLEGYIYIKSILECVGQKGPYKRGTAQFKKDVTYTIWGSNPEFYRFDNSLEGQIIYTKIQINEFNGKKNLIIQPGFTICNDPSITRDMLITDMKYDIENDSKKYLELLENNLSNKGFNLIKEILGINKENSLFDEFKVCYAATSNHDCCEGGLLAHSYKCLKIFEMFTNIYTWLKTFKTLELSNQDFLDLIYIGLAIHDIGKTKEIDQDKYLYDSFNSHRVLGFEMIVQYKELIVNTYNEHFYHLLVSILIGHHDEYDDKAKTIYAYIVHKIDEIESKFTNIDQMVDFDIFESPNGQYITLDKEHKLFI
jgi:3'-5' exoribonuclease